MDLYDFVRPKLNNLQFGFRRNRSAVSQMLVYLDKIYKVLDRGEQVEVLYTDFEKAFDMIDQAKILKNCETLECVASFGCSSNPIWVGENRPSV